MSLAQEFLAEFEHEAKTTRRFLERTPENKLSWRPHEKSMSAGQLALHIAGVPANVAGMARETEAKLPDFSTPFPEATSVKQLLDAHDTGAAQVREILSKFSDEFLGGDWHATIEGKRVMTMPRKQVIRAIMLNHWIQHRGQFGVYLRLLGAKVPASYGPSGDEQMSGA